MKSVLLKIKGMHCSSCAMNIDFDLEDLDGVDSCKTSYAKQESKVEYDESKISLDKILAQVKETGYQAQAFEK